MSSGAIALRHGTSRWEDFRGVGWRRVGMCNPLDRGGCSRRIRKRRPAITPSRCATACSAVLSNVQSKKRQAAKTRQCARRACSSRPPPPGGKNGSSPAGRGARGHVSAVSMSRSFIRAFLRCRSNSRSEQTFHEIQSGGSPSNKWTLAEVTVDANHFHSP